MITEFIEDLSRPFTIGGQEVMQRYRPEGSRGIPWFAILSASGKVLATSRSRCASEFRVRLTLRPSFQRQVARGAS